MALNSAHLDLLARDTSTAGRGRLLGDLTRLILVERDADETELEIFFDIVRAILSTAAASDRREFAEVAAGSRHVPHDVILILAEDEIRVAEPVLQRSVDLTDLDLIALAETKGDEHRLAIAARVSLSGAVTEVLVRNGSDAVLHRLGANQGAEFTIEAVREMQHRAERDEELFRILIERPDLADVLARCMRDTLRRIVEKSRTCHETAVAAARSGAAGGPKVIEVPAAAEAAPPPAKARLDERPDVARFVSRIRAGETTLDAAVSELADSDHHADLACLLGEVSRIDESQILRVLVRADSVGIATVARGLDIGEAAYNRIIELRQRRLKFSAGQARFEREHYGRVDVEEARAMITQHGGRRARA
ncbi:MAG: DUF2336 domain-containing protein [Siculibacillus sp.]|nr:DUF2336 domain-containing protein [Siculibacillus sp.]